MHDSKLFHTLIDEMSGYLPGFSNHKEKKLTVVFDKGMNSEENTAFFDKKGDIHFITTYSPYFAAELSCLPLSIFKVFDIPKNKYLIEKGKGSDQILFYRTKDMFWGKEHTVVITYYPRTARKKMFSGSHMGDGHFMTTDVGENLTAVAAEDLHEGKDTFRNQAVFDIEIANDNNQISGSPMITGYQRVLMEVINGPLFTTIPSSLRIFFLKQKQQEILQPA